MAIILNSGSNINVFECVNIVNDYSISVQWICYTVIVYRVSYRSSAARYSRTRYLSGGTTYHAPSRVATGPAPVITGAATLALDTPTVRSLESKISVSEKQQ